MNSPIDIMSGLNFKTLSSEINKIQSSHYQTSATAQRLESVIVPDWRHAGFSKGVKGAWLTAGCNQVATASLSIVWSVETRARDWINVEDPTITFTKTVLTWSSRNPSQDEEMKRCEERKKKDVIELSPLTSPVSWQQQLLKRFPLKQSEVSYFVVTCHAWMQVSDHTDAGLGDRGCSLPPVHTAF